VKRGGPLRRQSVKARQKEAARDAVRRVVLVRAGWACEARTV